MASSTTSSSQQLEDLAHASIELSPDFEFNRLLSPGLDPEPESFIQELSSSVLSSPASSSAGWLSGIPALSTAPRSFLTTATRKAHFRTSLVWDYCLFPKATVVLNKDKKSVWQCKFCRKVLLESGGTRHMSQHLSASHKIELNSIHQSRQEGFQDGILESWARVGVQNMEHKRRRLNTTVPTESLSPDVLEDLYIRWITTCGVAFSMTGRDEFRSLLRYLNPEVDCWLPLSPDTIQEWTIRKFNSYKMSIIKDIQDSLTKIHITVDLWTSGNHKAIIGVIGHYIGKEGRLKHNILALRELEGLHSGANQASVVSDIIHEFNFGNNLGFFVGDNVSSNDTLCSSLSQLIYEDLLIDWDPILHRLRCNGHIINLSAQSFLFPDILDVDEEQLNNDIQGLLSKEFTAKEMKEWREKGPLGKIHNIVIYIYMSTQRIKAFELESGGLGLSRDNQTRWNSWFRMLSRAVQLFEAIDVYCYKNKPALEQDMLSDQEWNDIKKMITFLEAYSDVTQACESRYATIDAVLPAMEFLLDTLERGKEEYKADSFIGPCCKAGWAKLEKYYSLTDRSPAYTAATILCPQLKWQYFTEIGWQIDWIVCAKVAVQDMWESQYKKVQRQENLLSVDSTQDQEVREKENTFLRWQKQKQARIPQPELDEYAQYIQSPPIFSVKDPRKWWLEPSQQATYPTLSKMALDLLSIPAMSAEVERLFSSCKITITDRRNRLGINSVEAIECLKSWTRSDNINFVDIEPTQTAQ